MTPKMRNTPLRLTGTDNLPCLKQTLVSQTRICIRNVIGRGDVPPAPRDVTSNLNRTTTPNKTVEFEILGPALLVGEQLGLIVPQGKNGRIVHVERTGRPPQTEEGGPSLFAMDCF
jgi:hypothetical protein